jgi:DNA-binding NarL/FixJ family response regulator
MIRIGVVEDQTLVRDGLERLLMLTPDIRVTVNASDGHEGARLLESGEIDVLLLDLRMPESNGVELLREANRMGSKIPCIVLTTFDDDDDILQCIRLGAKGILRKDVTLETLSNAIREVHAGGTLHMPSLTQRIVNRLQTKIQRSPRSFTVTEKLTERELQILRLMFTGLSNGEIGYALHVSEGTVKNHVSSILGKLGARDRIRAVLRAVEEGYV